MKRFAALFIMLLAAPPVMAQETANGSQYRSWAAFSYDEGRHASCYAVTKQATRTGAPAGAATSYIYVTHRPAESVRNVFQFNAGFKLKPGGMATLTVDDSRFSLFIDGGNAWARDAETDSAIVAALRKGSKMKMAAPRFDGTATQATFSLSGSGLALQAIDKLCK